MPGPDRKLALDALTLLPVTRSLCIQSTTSFGGSMLIQSDELWIDSRTVSLETCPITLEDRFEAARRLTLSAVTRIFSAWVMPASARMVRQVESVVFIAES